nr:alpha/beta fold hydrolase [Agrobacterium pusense]
MVFSGLACGPKEGETVLLLHGFPQFADSWAEVAVALAKAGYRAIAIDQRGYSAGARPETVRDYAVGRCHVVRLRPDEALSVKLRQLRRSRPSSAPWRGSDECGWRGRSVFDATGRNDF